MSRVSYIALFALIAIILAHTAATATVPEIISGDNMLEFLQSGGDLPNPYRLTKGDLLDIETEIYNDLMSDIENQPSGITQDELDEYNAQIDDMDLFNERENKTVEGIHDDLNGAFSETVLRTRAAYSSIARCLITNAASVTKWTCTWCNDGKVPKLTEVVGGIEGPCKLGWYAGYDKPANRIVLVFKSTGGIENWLLDLDFTMVPYTPCTNCKAHKGFVNGYRDHIRPAMLKGLQKLLADHKGATVVITGHSLGAAMTTHAALDLKYGLFTSLNFNGVEVIHNTNFGAYNDLSDDDFAQLYAIQHQQPLETVKTKLYGHKNHLPAGTYIPTSDLIQNNSDINLTNSGFSCALEYPIYNFGSPRVFNDVGSNWFNSHIGRADFRRVTHVGDTVTHVPTIALGGRHIGNEVYFYEKNLSLNYRVCAMDDSEDKTCGYKDVAIDFMQHKWYGGFSMLQLDADCK